jgi:hypothetical protein
MPLPEKIFNFLAFSAAVLAVCVVAWRGQAFGFFSYDDTYIGLRYVANFLDTGHFEWNIGEAVEGYTDPLRLLMIAALGALGMDMLEAARWINAVALGGFALLLFWIMLKRLGFFVALFPASLAAANTALIAWVWGGLDPPLTVFMIACAQAAMLEIFTNPERRNARWALISAACFAGALLVRLDSALYAVPAALAWLALDGKGKKNFLIFCGVIGGVVAAQMALRLAMYGELLPNTFYNKVMGTPAATFMAGLTYIYNGLKEYPFYYAGGIGALLLLAVFRKAYRGFALYAFAGMLLSAVYIAAVGGDFMPAFRFLMPWLPVCMIALALLMEIPPQPGKGAEVLSYAGFVIGALLLKACFTLPPDLKAIDGTAVAGGHHSLHQSRQNVYRHAGSERQAHRPARGARLRLALAEEARPRQGRRRLCSEPQARLHYFKQRCR